MNCAATIQELARQVRENTLQLLASADPAWLTWAPPGTSNHLLWHAGHALWLQDVLCVQAIRGRSELPAAWGDSFGMNCRPVRETAVWPGVDQLAKLLADQLEQICAAVNEGEDRLAEIVDQRGRSLAARIIHGLHDEAKHQGEMYLLIKQCRAAQARRG